MQPSTIQHHQMTSALTALLDADYRFNYQELLAQVELADKPLSLATIRFMLEKVEFNSDEVKQLVQFDEETYSRRRLFGNEHCEVLILSWLNGQRSKIHDHIGSACGVKILHGQATETLFEPAANGHIYATQSTHYPSGEVTVSHDSDIHQISNLQGGDEPLVTLHIYSPPLKQFYLYQLESGTAVLLDLQHDSWFYEI